MTQENLAEMWDANYPTAQLDAPPACANLHALTILEKHSKMSGRELKHLRSLTGLTQKELANLLQFSTCTIAKWERFEVGRHANIEAIVRLALAERLGLKLSATVAEIIIWCGQGWHVSPEPK